MHSFKLFILLALAISVLISYYVYLKSDKGYFDHPFWFGAPMKIVKILLLFQILTIFGFIMAVGSMLTTPPTTGFLGEPNNLFYVLTLFFVSAIVWPIATYYKNGWLSVFSVIFTAIASILLLAGSIEEDNPMPLRVFGLLLLCITTVLGDGVLWNANYIRKNRDLFKYNILDS
jgi:hypothetical protein